MVRGELIQVIESMLRRPEKVVRILRRQWRFDGNAEREDWLAYLGGVSEQPIFASRRRDYYLPLSPIRHVLQWQICTVYRRRLPPYWEAQAQHYGPEGEDGGPPSP